MDKKSKDGTVTLSADEARDVRLAARELRAFKRLSRGLYAMARGLVTAASGLATAAALDDIRNGTDY